MRGVGRAAGGASARADLIVVGAGGAGLAAALEAAARGALVSVVDTAHEVGGTASTAAAGTLVAGSPLQARLGIVDTPDLALADWLLWGRPGVDEEWARRYVEASAGDVYDWLSQLGVTWTAVRPQEGNSVPRWHAPSGGGRAVMGRLEEATRRRRTIRWHLGTRVTSLSTAGGRVAGVVGTTKAGHVDLAGDSVLVATGGFNSDPAMVKRFAAQGRPDAQVLLGGGLGARGEGHRLLRSAAADFVNLDKVWMYPYATPDPDAPGGLRGLVVRGLDGDVWVNAAGHRFHDESRRGGASGTVALLAQTPPTCWSVIDTAIAARYTVSAPGYRHGVTPLRARLDDLLERSPWIFRGADCAELANEAGIDRQLVKTIRDHNRLLRSGAHTDPQFGRPLASLRPLEQPPFYAVQFFPLARKNLGGVRTDRDCQVLDTAGRPIPGLLAAGEVAGMAGGRINGSAALEGTMLGPSLFSGRVAARQVVS